MVKRRDVSSSGAESSRPRRRRERSPRSRQSKEVAEGRRSKSCSSSDTGSDSHSSNATTLRFGELPPYHKRLRGPSCPSRPSDDEDGSQCHGLSADSDDANEPNVLSFPDDFQDRDKHEFRFNTSPDGGWAELFDRAAVRLAYPPPTFEFEADHLPDSPILHSQEGDARMSSKHARRHAPAAGGLAAEQFHRPDAR